MAQEPTTDADPMTRIMSRDDKIDALSEFRVMSLYVRAKLMRAYMEIYSDSRRPDGWESNGFVRAEQTLTHHDSEAVRLWASRESFDGVLSGWIGRLASDTVSEDFIIAVFDRMTNKEWDRERRVRAARAYLKDYLRGSLGMPDDRVIRHSLD